MGECDCRGASKADKSRRNISSPPLSLSFSFGLSVSKMPSSVRGGARETTQREAHGKGARKEGGEKGRGRACFVVRPAPAKVYLLLVLLLLLLFLSLRIRADRRVRELPRRLKTSDMNLPQAGEGAQCSPSLLSLAGRTASFVYHSSRKPGEMNFVSSFAFGFRGAAAVSGCGGVHTSRAMLIIEIVAGEAAIIESEAGSEGGQSCSSYGRGFLSLVLCFVVVSGLFWQEDLLNTGRS